MFVDNSNCNYLKFILLTIILKSNLVIYSWRFIGIFSKSSNMNSLIFILVEWKIECLFKYFNIFLTLWDHNISFSPPPFTLKSLLCLLLCSVKTSRFFMRRLYKESTDWGSWKLPDIREPVGVWPRHCTYILWPKSLLFL